MPDTLTNGTGGHDCANINGEMTFMRDRESGGGGGGGGGGNDGGGGGDGDGAHGDGWTECSLEMKRGSLERCSLEIVTVLEFGKDGVSLDASIE